MRSACILRDLPARQSGAVIMIMLLILVLGSAYFLLTTLNKGDPKLPRAEDQMRELGIIRDALLGFAYLNNGCLPCPSTNATVGTAPANCTAANRAGFLPWESLNLGNTDQWAHRYRYVVDPAFANNGCGALTLSSTGDIRIQTRDMAGALTDVALNQPAVVHTHGPNGFGARNPDGTALPNPPVGHLDEQANRTATTNFIQRPADSTAGIPGGPFDDQLTWVPLNELINQADKARTPPGLPP